MKNRSFASYALDIFGLVALVGAAFALAAAHRYAATAAEPVLLTTFTYGLFTAVCAFLVARSLELGRVFRAARPVVAAPAPVLAPLADNVESLAERKHLPRAA